MDHLYTDHTLDYLVESLSNWIEKDNQAMQLYRQLTEGHFLNEEAYVNALSESEQQYLHQILKKEMGYAKTGQDDVRLSELNEVDERLF